MLDSVLTATRTALSRSLFLNANLETVNFILGLTISLVSFGVLVL